MIKQGHHRNYAVAALGLLLCAKAACAGGVFDLASEATPSLSGGSPEEQFGYCVALGDLDGDGRDELMVGAPGLANSSGVLHMGAVYVFDAAVLDELEGDALASDLARWVLHGSGDHGRFGSSVVVGDLDGDGFDDLVVGAPAAGLGGNMTRGEVSVFFGGSDRHADRGSPTVPDVVITGTSPGARLGTFLLAHDLDRNGSSELLLSAPAGRDGTGSRTGAIHVIEGAALRDAGETAVAAIIAAATVTGETADDALSVPAIADTDGNGRIELLVGAYLADSPGLEDAGKVYSVEIPGEWKVPPVSAGGNGTPFLAGIVERGFLGRSMSVGDIDYDGVDDLLVSAYGSRTGGEKLEATGEAYVIFGGPGGATGASLGDPRVVTFSGDSRSDMFGLPVLLADVNGDAADDIVAAAQFADGPDNDRRACGEVHVYWGSLPSVIAAKAGRSGLADVTIVGESSEDLIGGTLFFADSSGGTGPALLVGAPNAPCEGDDGADIQRCGRLIVLSRESLLR